ncbi:unnamed protein product [Gadus morhua 'NCC']
MSSRGLACSGQLLSLLTLDCVLRSRQQSSEDLLWVSSSSHGALRTFSRSPPDLTELSLRTYSRLHLISRSSV